MPPKSFRARPTTDIAKEALFNILENNIDLSAISVLDLFSGTGNISYEFASRGVPDIQLVENNFQHIKFIRKTIDQLHLADQIQCFRSDVWLFLKHCTTRFDIIFADPPYDMPDISQLPEKILGGNLLNPGGWFILEHPKTILFEHTEGFLFLKKYGRVYFSFFNERESK